MNRFTGRLGAAFFMLASITSAFAGGNTTTNVPNTGTTAVAGFTCFSTQFCTGHVNINNTGTEIFTSGNPGRFDPTGTTTQPVSGTFWQATQPVSGTFWQATQPVSGTVAISSGTITAGGVAQGSTTSGQTGGLIQCAVTTSAPSYTTAQTSPVSCDTAGDIRVAAPSSQLLASGTSAAGSDPGAGIVILGQNGSSPTVSGGQTVALQVNGTGQLITTSGAVAQGSTTSGQSGNLDQCAVTTSAPSYTTAQTSPVSCDTAGNVRVNVVAGATGNSAAAATGSAVPANAGYTGLNIAGNLTGVTGTSVASTRAVDTNVALVAGAAIATGHGTASGAQRVELPTDGTGQVAISQTTPGTTNGVSPVLTTAGGWTPLRLAALTNTATAIKAAAGQLGMLYCYNPNATVVYAQIYNTASGGVSVGTTAAVLTLGIPATSNGGFPMSFPGVQFSTAISIALTTTATGSTAPATAVDCSAAYN